MFSSETFYNLFNEFCRLESLSCILLVMIYLIADN